MKEELIKFDTAKLAKEKGFDLDLEDILYFYTKPRSKMFGIDEHFRSYPIKNTPKKLYKVGEYACLNIGSLIPAPTQSLLQKWLREVHDIHVVPVPETQFSSYHEVMETSKYMCMVYCNNTYYEVFEDYGKWNYEEAFEVGLQKALKLIKC